jgi:pantothenate kinase
MPLDKSVLLNFLKLLDDEINKKITLVAVGGTAMTLLDLKPSTVDIDFTIPDNDKPVFDAALAKVSMASK